MQFLSLFATILAAADSFVVALSVLPSFQVAAAENNLTSFLNAINNVGLGRTFVASEETTIFAPTNQAFDDLFAFAVKNNLNITRDILTSVVIQHSIPGVVLASALKPANTISAPGNSSPAKVIKENIAVSQGIMHIIDTVLLPHMFSKTPTTPPTTPPTTSTSSTSSPTTYPTSKPTPPVLSSAVSASGALAFIAALSCVFFAL